MHQTIDLTPAIAQLNQCPYTKTSKRENSAGFQHTESFTEHRIKIPTPLHRKAGEDQIAG